MTSETETTPTAEKVQANGAADPKPRKVTTSKAGPVTVTVSEPAEDDCGCAEGEPGKAAAGLGLLICAVAGGLLYIGLDLVTGGGLSRKLGGAREEEE